MYLKQEKVITITDVLVGELSGWAVVGDNGKVYAVFESQVRAKKYQSDHITRGKIMRVSMVPKVKVYPSL